MKVKDIMAKVEAYLTEDMTLQEVVRIMKETKRKHGLSVKGMIVLDKQGKLVGILSLKDVIRTVIPHYVQAKLGSFTWEGMLEERAAKVKDRKVKEIMSTNVHTISPEASLMRCADLMIDKKMQRLPVVDGEGRVVGIVYIRDLYEIVATVLERE